MAAVTLACRPGIGKAGPAAAGQPPSVRSLTSRAKADRVWAAHTPHHAGTAPGAGHTHPPTAGPRPVLPLLRIAAYTSPPWKAAAAAAAADASSAADARSGRVKRDAWAAA